MTLSRMDTILKNTILNGHTPKNTFLNGHNPEWTQSRMYTVPNEHDPEWASTCNAVAKGYMLEKAFYKDAFNEKLFFCVM